jgi:hypothetical protein
MAGWAKYEVAVRELEERLEAFRPFMDDPPEGLERVAQELRTTSRLMAKVREAMDTSDVPTPEQLIMFGAALQWLGASGRRAAEQALAAAPPAADPPPDQQGAQPGSG